MNYFLVDILTPSKVLARNIPVDSLLIPTVSGQINVLPEHTHIITKLDTGVLSLFGGSDDPDRHFTVTTGICKVLGKRVTILSNVAEESKEIDIERAQRALTFAQDKLLNESLSDEDLSKFRRKIDRANLRIQIAKKYAAKQ